MATVRKNITLKEEEVIKKYIQGQGEENENS